MNITWKRFLLSKENYEEDLVFINNLVEQMLNNLKQSIPSEGAIPPPIISQAEWEEMKEEVAKLAPYADTPSIAELMRKGYIGEVVATMEAIPCMITADDKCRSVRPRYVRAPEP